MVARVKCPDCEGKFELGNRLVGDRFDCPECGVELEVMSIEPPELDWAYDYEEYDEDDDGADDWDEYDDEEDDLEEDD